MVIFISSILLCILIIHVHFEMVSLPVTKTMVYLDNILSHLENIRKGLNFGHYYSVKSNIYFTYMCILYISFITDANMFILKTHCV